MYTKPDLDTQWQIYYATDRAKVVPGVFSFRRVAVCYISLDQKKKNPIDLFHQIRTERFPFLCV